jgi:hypothetical protein
MQICEIFLEKEVRIKIKKCLFFCVKGFEAYFCLNATVDWTNVAQDEHKWRTFVNTVMNLRGTIKCGEFLDQLSEF